MTMWIHKQLSIETQEQQTTNDGGCRCQQPFKYRRGQSSNPILRNTAGVIKHFPPLERLKSWAISIIERWHCVREYAIALQPPKFTHHPTLQCEEMEFAGNCGVTSGPENNGKASGPNSETPRRRCSLSAGGHSANGRTN